MHGCHPTLDALLTFEEQRCGLPIRWKRYCENGTGGDVYRKEIQVVGPPATAPAAAWIAQGDRVHELEVAAFLPEGGEPIGVTLDGEFYSLASVVGRQIRLHFDLEGVAENPGQINVPDLFDSIFERALPLATDFVQQYGWEAEKARYVEWTLAGIRQQLELWRRSIQDNDYEVDRLMGSLAGMLRKNADLRQLVDSAEQVSVETRTEEAQQEMGELLQMMPDPVSSVALQRGKLRVVFSPFTIDYGGQQYDLGTFTAVIGDDVRITSDLGYSYPHPHVSREEIPCWGNLGAPVAKLLGERKHAALVVTLREFLQSYNPHDAYRRIETWAPDYDEDEDEDED